MTRPGRLQLRGQVHTVYSATPLPTTTRISHIATTASTLRQGFQHLCPLPLMRECANHAASARQALPRALPTAAARDLERPIAGDPGALRQDHVMPRSCARLGAVWSPDRESVRPISELNGIPTVSGAARHRRAHWRATLSCSAISLGNPAAAHSPTRSASRSTWRSRCGRCAIGPRPLCSRRCAERIDCKLATKPRAHAAREVASAAPRFQGEAVALQQRQSPAWLTLKPDRGPPGPLMTAAKKKRRAWRPAVQ